MTDWSKLFPSQQTPGPLSPGTPAPSTPDLDLRQEFEQLVRQGAFVPCSRGGGASSLSQLTIDTDKDWEGYSITNLNDLQVIGTLISLGVLRVPIDATATGEGDIRYNSTTQQLEYYNGTEWTTVGTGSGGGGTAVSASATGVSEGNYSLTGLEDNYSVETLIIETSSTDWTMTVYSRDDYSSDELLILKNRNGDITYYWDYNYEDKDGSSEFHYNFTDNGGSATYNIELLGTSLT